MIIMHSVNDTVPAVQNVQTFIIESTMEIK